MDSLASLALATEEPKLDLLKRPPYRKKEYIISPKMVKHILGMSLYQAVVLFVFVFAGFTFVSESVVYKNPDTGDEYKTHLDATGQPYNKAWLVSKGGLTRKELEKHSSWTACE